MFPSKREISRSDGRTGDNLSKREPPVQPIYRQFVNLINHNTIQWYSKWNTSTCFFFYKQSEFRKQAWAWLLKKLVQAQSMLALCLFIKILLGVSLRKRLDQAGNMSILEKLLYKMCCCCDTDYNIISHLASSERHLFCCIFDESEEKCLAILKGATKL